MELQRAVDSADAFLGKILDDPTDSGLAAAVADDPLAADALWAVLHDRFVNAGEGFGALEGDPLFWRVVVIAAATWSDAQRARFAAETLFAAAAPDVYRWIAPLARSLYRPIEAERLIIAAIERGDATTRMNASHLAYHLFHGDPDYAMTEVGARRLRASDPFGGNG